MSESVPALPDARGRRPRPAGGGRIALGLVVIALVLSVAQGLTVSAFVLFVFGSPAGAVGLVFLLAATAAALAGVLRVATGRARVLLAVSAALATAVLLGAAVVLWGIPILWGPWGFDLAYPIIAVIVAGWLGLMLGPARAPRGGCDPRRGRPLRHGRRPAGDLGRVITAPPT